jgi:uncharacterized protein (TIRG00374 family)
MKIFFIIVKLILSFGLLGFCATQFDFQSSFKTLGTAAGFKALTIGIFFVLLQAVLGGVRLPCILKLYHYSLTVLTSLRIYFVGSFFSQILISFVGGDAMRVWSLTRLQIPVRIASSAILLDRIMGFISMIVLFLITLPSFLKIIKIPMMRYNLILLGFISVCAIIIFCLLGKLPVRARESKRFGFLFELISTSRYLRNSVKNSAHALCLSLVIQIANWLAIYSMFHIYGVDVDLYWCLVISIPAMFIAALPISIAGWGIRESAMALGFGLLGVSTEKTLVVSITLGFSILLTALPGVFLFLFERKRDFSLKPVQL